MTLHGADGRLRYGWDGEVETPFLGLVDDVPVAVGTVATSEYDNLHLAWLGLKVHPDQPAARARHRDAGGAGRRDEVARAHLDRHRRLGRRGAAGLRGAARARGEEPGGQPAPAPRRGGLGRCWSGCTPRRMAAASAYELVRQVGRTPDDELAAVAEMSAAINDAPTDDLDIEDEVFSPERVRAYEDGPAREGRRRSTGSWPGTARPASWPATRWSRSRASGRSSGTSTTPRWWPATAATGSACCSRPR